ncbi:aldo/keto reductase [Telmatocola sphagniphila]|uniref:Aldo/keto reductase n=1 Tax=Telmatocola sphagniphila TaxID=1123043 RepID=A0A8E6B4U9_9BACT|nr:aldo/keto reductase [Telmatocola sphagniphila]QVL31947.1 aldo/keto reductase [Telmatocola sphagniphila]
MQLRPLGRTGLNVSALSLGGAAFGNIYGNLTLDQIRRTVVRSIESGINLIDTSPYYGLTKSESNLGEVLQHGWREKIILCSKAGRNDRAAFDFSPEAMRRSVEASLKRLRTDYLDILIAHDIEFTDNFEKVFTETRDVLHALKKEGKCRFIGMSCYPLSLLKKVIETCQIDVIITYSNFCLQNTRLIDELLPTLEKFEVGVLNASPLSMGLLTNQGPPEWHPASPEIKAACRKAAEHCRNRGSDISLLGMQFCLAESRISSVISGASTEEEIQTNLQALSQKPDPQLLAKVLEILKPVHNQTWFAGNWKT